jgi:DegV family protein with EDD domain
MPRVAVVTDTTHYLPADVVAERDLHLVSLYVHWSDRHEREIDMPDFDAFYEQLRSPGELPTTSQPSVGDFLAVYQPLLDDGRDIVSVHISADISGTYGSALQARTALEEQGYDPGRIEVVDSQTTAGGLGLVVLAAAAAAAAGHNQSDVVQRARDARQGLKIWFAVDTLEFLRRGGRIGAAQAWVGSALKIKPILTLEREVTPIERVRTRRRAMERLGEFLVDRREAGADGWTVQHIQAADQAELLVQRGRELLGTDPAFVSEIGPVIGTHAGPGLLGVGGIPAALLE